MLRQDGHKMDIANYNSAEGMYAPMMLKKHIVVLNVDGTTPQHHQS